MSKSKEWMEGGEKSKRCRNEESWIMDGMSVIPDELLVIILSHLTLKEAAATCILSRRWRYLWTFTDKLDLDGTNSSKLGENRSKYVIWVNHVIASRNNSAPVHYFRLSFNLNKYNEEHIHEWIRYALERKVQTLDLNFNRKGCVHDELCSIPYRVLKETCNSIHFKQLRRVSLEAVNVSGEALEFLLHNCPLLEGLSVCESRELVTLKVIKPFPSFKLLEIRLCDRLESVEIRDANLVSLKFSSSWRYVWFFVENSPALVELSIGQRIQFLDCFLLHFWSILDQLEMLNVEMLAPDDCRIINLNLIKLRHLKQLVVTYLPTRRNYSPPSLTNIIRAAPRLEKFELKTEVWQLCWVRRIEEEEKKNLYEKTKELRVVGYGGTIFELEFVKHLVEKAVALQKVTIHRNLMNDTKIEARAWVKAHARRLLANQLSHPIIIEIL